MLERRVTAKAAQFLKRFEEDLLDDVLDFAFTARVTTRRGEDARLIFFHERLKAGGLAVQHRRNQLRIGPFHSRGICHNCRGRQSGKPPRERRMVTLRNDGVGGLVVRDFQRSLELFGKLPDFLEDFLRLLGEITDHAIDHFRLATDQFQGCHHQGEMIIDVVSQVREFPMQLSHLLRTERNSLTGQTHGAYHGLVGP